MFIDVSEKKWSKNAISAVNFVVNANIMPPYLDGKFYPLNSISNTDFCKIIYDIFYESFYSRSSFDSLANKYPLQYIKFVEEFKSRNNTTYSSDKLLATRYCQKIQLSSAITILNHYFDRIICNCQSYPLPPSEDDFFTRHQRRKNILTRITLAKIIYWYVKQFINQISSLKKEKDILRQFEYWKNSPINPFLFALNLQQIDLTLFNTNNKSFFYLFDYFKDQTMQEALCLYEKMQKTKAQIDSILTPINKTSLFQYTTIQSLYKMLTESNKATDDKPPEITLRLSNVAFLNDPDEGNIFAHALDNMLNDKALCSKYHHYNNTTSDSSPEDNTVQTKDTYIICFTTSNKERLPMWVQYANNAQGCRIEFDAENLTCYPLQYVDSNEQIPEIMKQLAQDAQQTSDSKLKKFILSNLYELQYYYKNKYYEHEEEVRYTMTVPLSNAKSENNPRDGEYVPRLYCDIPSPLKIKSVTLGPKCPNPEQVALYLKKMNVPVVYHSEIHYR